MQSNDFDKLLKEKGSKHVYNHILLNEDVYIFKLNYPNNHVDIYHHFKVVVSNALDVPVKNVAIVGSSKTGYSITPGRSYSLYSNDSDLDLVIVSEKLFMELWGGYLSFVNSFSGRAYNQIAKNVFKHFISVKQSDLTGDLLPYFSEWTKRVDALKRDLELTFKLPSEINYRVYDEWKYVEQYHVSGLNVLMES
ncbi:hypothetical protein [Aeromonas veronii]